MIFYKGTTIEDYIDFHLNNRLKGVFDLYKNKDGKFHHKSKLSLNEIDLTFWTYIKTIVL